MPSFNPFSLSNLRFDSEAYPLSANIRPSLSGTSGRAVVPIDQLLPCSRASHALAQYTRHPRLFISINNLSIKPCYISFFRKRQNVVSSGEASVISKPVKSMKSGIAEKTFNFYVITRSFAKTKRRGDLKTIRVEIAIAL